MTVAPAPGICIACIPVFGIEAGTMLIAPTAMLVCIGSASISSQNKVFRSTAGMSKL